MNHKQFIKDNQHETHTFTANTEDSKLIFMIKNWLDDNGIGGCKIIKEENGDTFALFENISIRVEDETEKNCAERHTLLSKYKHKFNSQLNNQHETQHTPKKHFMHDEFLADC
ncbi:hypothetical protein [uncultured Deefgea sp.]|uniref:hypothetical protein n=1 Tax=uncultured Deefgea sp. TaxID=1304914 RepID=UPI00262FEF5F|nr:hypothetical protein [uncultured Deefgea sp.]